MSEINERIDELQARLDSLVRTQIDFQREISQIRHEMDVLRADEQKPVVQPPPKPTPPVREIPPSETAGPKPPPPRQAPPRPVEPPTFGYTPSAKTPASDSPKKTRIPQITNLEEFIGENLISKIGIVVLIIGVGIGAKYAIDKGWITPMMRIVFGYAVGVALIGFAVRLKPKYHNFSAVLFSGGMAVMYFITYFAYSLYGLISQPGAFGLMFVFTGVAVASAINYSRQVIAHIGLVGAYAIPFLLSEGSGNYTFLFFYMAVINAGILAISVKRVWKPLFYTSSAFTWLIFLGWLTGKYTAENHFYLALTFLGVFFAIFYATKIVHGYLHPELDQKENLISTVVTVIVFYGLLFGIADVKAANTEYAALFTYLATFSLAILITSYRFYGRALVAVSCPATWLILGAWFVNYYSADTHFYLAAIFATVFFLIYYGATLIYRLLTDKIELAEHAGLLLTNSFVFYGFGYGIVDSRTHLQAYEGLFTLGHGVFHYLVAQLIGRVRPAAADVVQVLTVLIVTFATIAVPVQFDGHYITLVWSVEAAVLFYFGRTKALQLFEYLSLPVIVLATGSLFSDWIAVYSDRMPYTSEFNRQPIANGEFVTALVFVAAFIFIYLVNRNDRCPAAIRSEFVKPFGYAIAAIGLIALYNTFRIEIDNYYHIKIAALGVRDAIRDPDEGQLQIIQDLGSFNIIWQLNYTMAFLAAMAAANLRKLRSEILAYANVIFSVICFGLFVTVGMYLFNELRVVYMTPGAFEIGPMHLAIRYISYAITAALLFCVFRYKRTGLLDREISKEQRDFGFDALFHIVIFVAASCEIVNLMAQFHIPDATKLGLSVLWGIYALALIVAGIAKSKKHLRIAAFVLLAVTLVKLFFYDIADLPTIQKTVLFVSLGLLMLVVSFLYNKYRNFIFGSAEGEE